MPKEIFSAQNGLSQSIHNEDGKFSVGKQIDLIRDWGFIKPGFSATAITGSLASSLQDMAELATTPWVIDDDKLYTIVTGALNQQRDFSGASIGDGRGIVNYEANVSSSKLDCLFYIATAKMGRHDGTNYTDAFHSFVDTSAEHPYIIWESYLILGDGRYVMKYDGSSGADGTFSDSWFDVGQGWYVKGFFKYENYLGIIARDLYSRKTDILIIDGTSPYPIRRISVKEKVVLGANLNNSLIFVTQDRNSKCWLKELGNSGLEPLYELKFEDDTTIGTLTSYSAPTEFAEYDIYDNKLAFASGGYVLLFGKNLGGVNVLYKPFKPTGQTITSVRWGVNGKLYVGSYTSTNYYLEEFSTGNSTATLKFPFKDFGQKVRINYVKFYFKPFTTGDSITCGIDTDYATATSLGTLTYTALGAITSKRFDIKKLCHSFRPTEVWNTGGNSLSHVVVDYDFVEADI